MIADKTNQNSAKKCAPFLYQASLRTGGYQKWTHTVGVINLKQSLK